MKKTFSPIILGDITPHKFKSDINQIEVRQTVITEYPSRDVSNTLFDESEFGLEATSFKQERVAWIPVPKTATKEQVQEKLVKSPDACIQRILSSEPILLPNDVKAIEQGLTTKEVFAASQTVRDKEGNVVMFNNRIQYARNIFRTAHADDIDTRIQEPITEVIITKQVVQPAVAQPVAA